VVSSEAIMLRIAENYRKIRNTFRYILGNLHEFDPSKDAVAFGEMEAIDQYMLLRMAAASKDVNRWYEDFQFHKVYQQLLNFCTVDLSAVYFDVLKDRLYTSAPKAKGRRSAQTALWKIGEALARLLAPVMSFTADEVWQYMPAGAGREPSVHIAKFMAEAEIADQSSGTEKVSSDWQLILQSREEVLKALEEARNNKQIGSGLEARVTLEAPAAMYPVLERYADQLRFIYIVSVVELKKSTDSNGTGTLKIAVDKAPGEKCERCWNYSTHVGEDKDYPTVCERCSAVLGEIEKDQRG